MEISQKIQNLKSIFRESKRVIDSNDNNSNFFTNLNAKSDRKEHETRFETTKIVYIFSKLA